MHKDLKSQPKCDGRSHASSHLWITCGLDYVNHNAQRFPFLNSVKMVSFIFLLLPTGSALLLTKLPFECFQCQITLFFKIQPLLPDLALEI